MSMRIKNMLYHKNRWSCVFALLVAPMALASLDVVTKPIVPDFSHRVSFERVSLERMKIRQEVMSKKIAADSTTRERTTIAAVSTTAALSTLLLWYCMQRKAPEKTHKPLSKESFTQLEEDYFRREFAEKYTFTGSLKKALRLGVAGALTGVALSALKSTCKAAGCFSFKEFADFVYPTNATLCDRQDSGFTKCFSRLSLALQNFENERALIQTPEQFDVFIKCRSLVSFDLQSSLKALVYTVENLGALIFEHIERALGDKNQDEIIMQPFQEMVGLFFALIDAIDDFSVMLDTAANVQSLLQLKANNDPLGMAYKKIIHVTQAIMQPLESFMAIKAQAKPQNQDALTVVHD